MKKLLALLLVVMIMVSLAACGKGECEICGETAVLKEVEFEGEKGKVCEDCAKDLKELEQGLKDLENALNELS